MKRHLNEEGDVGEQCSSEVRQENAQKRQKHGDQWWSVSRIGKAMRYAEILFTGSGQGIKPPPTNLAIAASQNKRNTPNYNAYLKAMSNEKPTSKQMEELYEAGKYVPNYLGRTAALSGGFAFNQWSRGTNGLTTHDLIMPAADTHRDLKRHAKLQDMSQGEHTYMLAQHLMWYDNPRDEWLSYSNSLIFLIVHALNRHNEGQGPTTIQFIDTDRLHTPDGTAADVCPAQVLYDMFDLSGFRRSCRNFHSKLCIRKFLHEFLSFGTLKVKDERFQPVTVEELEREGLYELKAELEIPEGYKHGPLYGTQVYLRSSGYPPSCQTSNSSPSYSYTHCARSMPITESILHLAARLARTFMRIPEGEDSETYVPHLHVFLLFLTLDKRPKKDPVFVQWIRDRYTAADVKDLYQDETGSMRPGFNRIPANLPENMQYFDLVDDANFALGLPGLPAMEVIDKHELTGAVYVAEDAKFQKDVKRSTLYDPVAHQVQRKKVAERRRKEKKVGVAQEQVQEQSQESVQEQAQQVQQVHQVQQQ